MNNFTAKVRIEDKSIKMDYEYLGREYTIEVPKTDNNVGMVEGEIVQVMLGVMPIDDEEKDYSKAVTDE